MTIHPRQSRTEVKPNILLIDSDEDMHSVLQLVLEYSGTGKLFSARTGLEGVETARRVRPDAILLETRLSDLKGELLLRILKSHPFTRSIPVILFTGCAADLDFFDRLPYVEAVLKPFCTKNLCAVIRRTVSAAQMPSNARCSTVSHDEANRYRDLPSHEAVLA